MFEQVDPNTTVKELEDKYGISLNARSDMKLKTLLVERGFDSWTKFLKAFRGGATSSARARQVFPSFHAEDISRVNGLRLMIRNPDVNLDFDEASLKNLVNSGNSTYIKQSLSTKIERSEVLLCLIGNGTGWREMVNWEIGRAIELRKGICAVRIRGTYGKIPDLIREHDFPSAQWDTKKILAAVECAAARRS
jgi:hypothetical protein